MKLTTEQKTAIKNDLIETLRERGGCGGEFLRRTVGLQNSFTFGRDLFDELTGDLISLGLIQTKITGDGRRLFWLTGQTPQNVL